jgi:hypothetical protein
MNQQLLVTMLCNVHCIEPFEMKVNTFDLLVLQKSCSFFCWQCLLEDFSFLLLEVFAGAPRQDLSIIAPAIGEWIIVILIIPIPSECTI